MRSKNEQAAQNSTECPQPLNRKSMRQKTLPIGRPVFEHDVTHTHTYTHARTHTRTHRFLLQEGSQFGQQANLHHPGTQALLKAEVHEQPQHCRLQHFVLVRHECGQLGHNVQLGHLHATKPMQ